MLVLILASSFARFESWDGCRMQEFPIDGIEGDILGMEEIEECAP